MTPSPPDKKSQVTKKMKEGDNVPLPPPIKVSNVNDFNIFRTQIKSVVTKPIHFKAVSNNDINITVDDETDYRKVTQWLVEVKEADKGTANSPFNKLEFHTYQLKSDKWYRIAIRGLPASTKHEDIKQDINVVGHEVAVITPIVQKSINKSGEKTIKVFPLFYVDLVQKENNKEIYNIR